MDVYSRRAITGFQIGVLVFLLVIVAFAGYFVYYTTTHGSTVATTTSNVAYNIGVTWNAINEFTGASFTSTNPVTSAFQYQGSLASLSTLFGVSPASSSIAAGSTVVNVPVSQASLTANHILFSIYTGDSQYPDVGKLLSALGYIDGAKWIPVSNSGRNDLVVSVNLASLPAPNYAINPSQTLPSLNIPEAPQTTLSSVSISCIQCTSTGTGTGKIISIGTTANTNQPITFRITGVTQNDGWATTQWQFVTNESTSSVITMPSQINFGDNQAFQFPQSPVFATTPSAFSTGANSAGQKVITQIAFGNALTSYSTSGVPTTWQIWPGLTTGFPTNQLSSAMVFGNPQNGPGDTTVSLTLQVSMPSTGAVQFQLGFTTITGAGATASGNAGYNQYTVTLSANAYL